MTTRQAGEDFVVTRGRDAYATIRGYVLQFDCSILRWLEMPADAELLLERGEDIALVSRSLLNGEAVGPQGPQDQAPGEDATSLLSYRLEQVKHSQGRLTLRRASVVEALANFVEHRLNNPSLPISFLYSTNSALGHDQPRLVNICYGASALEAWQRLSHGKIAKKKISPLLKELRVAMLGLSAPDGLNSETWSNFRREVKRYSNADLLDFIRRFEWPTAALDAEGMALRIQSLLLEQGHARDADEAREQYHRLFCHVARLLCRPGTKALSRWDLEEQLALSPLGHQESQQMRHVQVALKSLQEQVRQVQRGVEEVREQHSQLRGEVREQGQSLAALQVAQRQLESVAAPGIAQLLSSFGLSLSDALGATSAGSLSLEVPQEILAAHLTQREQTVRELLGQIEGHTWMAVQGGAGWGKTHLAVLTATTHLNCRAWLSLSGCTSEVASLRLDAACRQLTGAAMREGRPSFDQMCKYLGEGALLVLDDLPAIAPGGSLPLSADRTGCASARTCR